MLLASIIPSKERGEKSRLAVPLFVPPFLLCFSLLITGICWRGKACRRDHFPVRFRLERRDRSWRAVAKARKAHSPAFGSGGMMAGPGQEMVIRARLRGWTGIGGGAGFSEGDCCLFFFLSAVVIRCPGELFLAQAEEAPQCGVNGRLVSHGRAALNACGVGRSWAGGGVEVVVTSLPEVSLLRQGWVGELGWAWWVSEESSAGFYEVGLCLKDRIMEDDGGLGRERLGYTRHGDENGIPRCPRYLSPRKSIGLNGHGVKAARGSSRDRDRDPHSGGQAWASRH